MNRIWSQQLNDHCRALCNAHPAWNAASAVVFSVAFAPLFTTAQVLIQISAHLVMDYKVVDVLRKFVTEDGRIRPRRQTGTCARHQRRLAHAVKRARHLAMLPFTGGSWEESLR